MAGTKGKGTRPGSNGNLRGLKNGTAASGSIARLRIGNPPPSLKVHLRAAIAYRKGLEEAVLATHGEVDLVMAHQIDLATHAERHACICGWLLRERIDDMPTDDIIACSREILKSKETRNRAVARLKLDASQGDLLDALYSAESTPTLPQAAIDALEAEEALTNASGAEGADQAVVAVANQTGAGCDPLKGETNDG